MDCTKTAAMQDETRNIFGILVRLILEILRYILPVYRDSHYLYEINGSVQDHDNSCVLAMELQ